MLIHFCIQRLFSPTFRLYTTHSSITSSSFLNTKIQKLTLNEKCAGKNVGKFIFICAACINEDIKLSHNGGCFIIRFSSFHSPFYFTFFCSLNTQTGNVHLLFFIILHLHFNFNLNSTDLNAETESISFLSPFFFLSFSYPHLAVMIEPLKFIVWTI